MGEPETFDAMGAMRIVGSPPGVVAVVVTGFVSFAILGDVLTEAERALEGESEPAAVVLDVSDIEGFEPGVPARVIHWLGAHSHRVGIAALVTTRPQLQALVRAAEVMLPRVACFCANTLGEAVAMASGMLAPRRRRSETGVRRRASGPLLRELDSSAERSSAPVLREVDGVVARAAAGRRAGS